MEKQRVKDVLYDIENGVIKKVFIGSVNYLVDMEISSELFYCPIYWHMMCVNFSDHMVTIAIQKDKFNKLYQNNG